MEMFCNNLTPQLLALRKKELEEVARLALLAKNKEAAKEILLTISLQLARSRPITSSR